MGCQILDDDPAAVRVLYLAPWVDIGGSDTATIDWFRFLPRERFRASLITTQPSTNRRLHEVAPYAEELWELPQLMGGPEFPRFILSFIHTRDVRVVHVMNSRLGFDLLPDIHCLPNRPRIVVQFHGEEPDQGGYVRYVTTRYGNLVDAYSLTTSTADPSLDKYEVPIGKRRLIPIGVDAEHEFSPRRVRPIEGLDPTCLQILFAGRLTAQKDPLLMVEVATRLRAHGLRFQLHVLGDGDLAEEVARRIHERGLRDEVLMHGACIDVRPWYRRCDLVLMTSAYETGNPRVAHEAMAMALPVVAPRLPGLEELVTPETGTLVDPSGGADAYASALRELGGDPRRRRSIGEAARARVRADFTVAQMAAEHVSLYEELLGTEAPRPSRLSEEESRRSHERPSGGATSFARRPAPTRPLVSVIITCFNQGRYLPSCLASVAHQTYAPIETILVDDCSTEAETLEALEAVEREGSAKLVRLRVNSGPSAARNRGIELADGRYVLPLDCDDLLPATAISGLVDQLQTAMAEVGFIYPSLQFFGNRRDYQEMPSYNLHGLLSANQCPVSSLIDRDVFERGLRYPEEITLGDEDWDFVLTLAEHGVYGQAAKSERLLCRKHGFNRSDLVQANQPFGRSIEKRHPRLFATRGLLKGQWNPSLTIAALDPVETTDEAQTALREAATSQTCPDFELIVSGAAKVMSGPLERRLRSLEGHDLGSRAKTLARAVELARGRYIMATYGSPTELLADPALVEKLLRILSSGRRIRAIALAEADDMQVPLRLLDAAAAKRAKLCALCWTAAGPNAPLPSHRLPGSRPLEDLAHWHTIYVGIQWRHLPQAGNSPPGGDRPGPPVELGVPAQRRSSDAHFGSAAPELPKCPPEVRHRLKSTEAWVPSQTRSLYRHRDPRTGRYVFTNAPHPPDGYAPDHLLGCVRAFPFQGTVTLRMQAEVVVGDDQRADPGDPALLGFADQTPLALFDELRLARHPRTGQDVLVAGDEDPLAAVVDHGRVVGYVEPQPLRPRLPGREVTYGVAGLLRSVDLAARRHRYRLGEAPPGLPAGELGVLFTEPRDDCDPLWIDTEGRVFTVASLPNGRPSPGAAARWIADPLTWTGFSDRGPKLRASARRIFDSARAFASASSANGRQHQPSGYLLRTPTERALSLHAGVHPVTGDQLLTTEVAEITELGYRYGALLGYVIARAPVTGKLGPQRPAAPWAARFGQVRIAEATVAEARVRR